jgi:hypothetical protein
LKKVIRFFLVDLSSLFEAEAVSDPIADQVVEVEPASPIA